MDRDGTKDGYDLELMQKVTNAVNVPVIASGGAGKKEHFVDYVIKEHRQCLPPLFSISKNFQFQI
jgi:imidazole glycerol phosphate synthase subunit HisF